MKVKLAHGTAQLIKLKDSGWYLYSIIVDENYRNRRIGTRIMQKIIRTCDPPIYLLATSELGGDGIRLECVSKRIQLRGYATAGESKARSNDAIER